MERKFFTIDRPADQVDEDRPCRPTAIDPVIGLRACDASDHLVFGALE